MSERFSSNRHGLRALLVVALALGFALVTLCSITSFSPASAQRSGYRLIVFKDTGAIGMGARIQGPVDARQLRGTPRGFQKYVGAEGKRAANPGFTTNCDTEDRAVYVRAYTTNHFAAGAGSPCGGSWGNARVIVGKVHHHWKVLLATQDAWSCRGLRRHHVPVRLIKAAPAPYDAHHNCYDYKTQKPGNYRHR